MFAAIARTIGQSVERDMIRSGEMDRIVRATMRSEWLRLADEARHPAVAAKLREMAEAVSRPTS